jgi:hypothetical protein
MRGVVLACESDGYKVPPRRLYCRDSAHGALGLHHGEPFVTVSCIAVLVASHVILKTL